jgi:hypothetical protein
VEPLLITPDACLVDELARVHMERVLRDAPGHVAGVAAELGELPPGSSYRVQAEWQLLDFPNERVERTGAAIRGAALVRPGVRVEARGDVVEVDGTVLLDRGVHVFDSRRMPGPLAVASSRGRPAFPRRPIVAFVACDADRSRIEWASALVDALLSHDVEGRLLVPEMPPGPLLTRPCTNERESLDTLRPDVVVALDATARAEVPNWCRERNTVIVHVSDDPDMHSELVSWRIGRASGRCRARIGRGIDAPALAALLSRLCAGPQPMPPAGDTRPRDRRLGPASPEVMRRHTATSVVVVADSTATPMPGRTEALVDQLAAAGFEAGVERFDGADTDRLVEADIVVVSATAVGTAPPWLIDRRDAGRATIADLLPSDLVGPGDATLDFSPAAVARAQVCGAVTAPAGATYAAAGRLAARVLALPTLLRRSRAAALEQAYADRPAGAGSDPVIGWHLPATASCRPLYEHAVLDALMSLLRRRSSVRVHLVGTTSDVLSRLTTHERVRSTAGEVDAATLASWSVHLYTPALRGGLLADDAVTIFETAHVGVPSVGPAPAGAAGLGDVPDALVVADPMAADAWTDTLQSVLDDVSFRSVLSRGIARRSHAVRGAIASQAVAQRFVGWAMFGRAR